MEQLCDNVSVGVILQNPQGEVLLLNRARFPYGLAPPAGHLDDHDNLEQAAVTEVYEEVGLSVATSSLVKVIDARRVNNKCRRKNGNFHIWTVYTAENIEGQITASPEETDGATWQSPRELQQLADQTRSNPERAHYAGAQILELIWLEFFTELGFFK